MVLISSGVDVFLGAEKLNTGLKTKKQITHSDQLIIASTNTHVHTYVPTHLHNDQLTV